MVRRKFAQAAPTSRVHASALIYFDTAWRQGSFRAAARQLNIAPSAVNRQVAALETSLGAPLFERLAGGLRLTAAGEIFAHHANMVVQDFERAHSEIEALKGLRRGHVEIVTVDGLCVDLLPTAIEAMKGKHADVTFGIDLQGIPDIPAAIVKGDAHLGIAFQVPRHPELRQVSLDRFQVGAIMRPDHPLARRKQLNIAACAAFPLIIAKENLAIRQQLAPAILKMRIQKRHAFEAASLQVIKQLALRGLGIAFQTRIGLEAELQSGKLVHIPLHENGPITQDLGIYARAGAALPVAVETSIQFLAAEIRRRQEQEPEAPRRAGAKTATG